MAQILSVGTEILRSWKHSRGKRYYSETGEDAILFDIFKKGVGRYLDVGAAHPVVGSNTYGLYRRGWSGVGVDLLSEFKPLWRIIRPRDSFYVGAANSEAGEIEFAKFKNKLLSTTDKEVIAFHERKSLIFETLHVRTLNISTLLPKVLKSSDNFVLNVDVEGSEFQVLELIDFQIQRPKVICIESWSVPWESDTKSHEYLLRHDYVLYAYTGLSSFYIASECINDVRGIRAQLPI